MGGVGFAEVCCSSDNTITVAMTLHGGRAVQHNHWNGFDLTTKASTEILKLDLLEKKPRVVWITPRCTTQHTQQSQSRSKFHRIQVKILSVFLWFVQKMEVDESWSWWCFLRFERMGSWWKNTWMSAKRLR